MATNVFSSIHAENLLKIAKQEGLEVKDTESKTKIVKKINVAVEECGISQLAESLKLLELQEVCGALDIDHGENNPKHKVVLKKRLVEKMMEEGVSKFLASLPQSKLDTFLAALGMKSLKSKDENVSQLTDAIYTMGAQTFLSKFDVPFLKQCAKDLKIKCPTESKAKIVTAIITQTAPEIEEKDTRIVFSSKKLPIKKGSTYQDIFQWYNLEELVEYCKENGLKVSGKKKEVINRILAFLDGDKENTMAKVNNNKEDSKKEAAKDEKKAQKPKSVPKKSKEVEEDEEAAPKQSPKSKSKKQDSLMQDLFNLIKKDGISQILTEYLNKALPGRPGYVEGEVDSEQEDFNSWISEFTEEFEEIQSSLSHKVVDGYKTWQTKDGQLVVFLMYEGEDIWSFACKLPKHFLCFGNCAGHPFVETSKFSFLNQDGSTMEDELPCKKVTDVRKVFDFMCERVNEFLFNPQ